MLLLVFSISYGQYYDINTIIPNSPTTAKFEEVVLPKINEFNGTLDFKIPIYTITQDDITIPIYLQYDSRGVRVEEEAGWVGQSWTLVAGSIITRNQVGIPDDIKENVGFKPTSTPVINPITGTSSIYFCTVPEVYDNCGWFYSKNIIDDIISIEESNGSYVIGTHQDEIDYFWKINYGAADTAPDFFNMYLSGGQSERFFFEDLNTIHFSDKNSIKLNYSLDPNLGIQSFDVTDIKGTQYKFNNIEYLRYQRENYVSNSYPATPSTPAKTTPINRLASVPAFGPYSFWDAYGNAICWANTADPDASAIAERLWPKAWHVSEIKTTKGSRITYQYENETFYKLSNTNYQRNLYASTPSGGIFLAYNGTNELQKIVYPRLKSITWDLGEIRFISNATREDVYSNSDLHITSAAKKLDKIVIYDNRGNIIKQIAFKHSYKMAEGYSNSLPEHEKSLYKRLYLDEIQLIDSNSEEYNAYKFEYNSTLMPYKFSFEQDYWGYFNNNNGTSFLPNLWWYPDEQRDHIDQGLFSLYPRPSYSGQEKRSFDYHGGAIAFSDRRPNGTFSKAGTLEKVIYPTGGEMLLEYEQNQFSWRGTTVDGPGLRIKTTTLKESTNDVNPLIVDYVYDSNGQTNGKLRTLPVFAGTGRYLSPSTPTPSHYISSYPMNFFNSAFNADFGYTKVEKLFRGNTNGLEEKQFSFLIDLGATSYTDNHNNLIYETSINHMDTHLNYIISGAGDPLHIPNTTDYYPFPPETNVSIANGKPTAINSKDQNGNLVQSVSYNYEFDNNPNFIKSLFVSPGEGTAVIKYLSTKHLAVQNTVTDHFSNSQITNSTSYLYNEDYLISETSTVNSKGQTIREKHRYPRDLIVSGPSSNVYEQMVDKNMLDFSIEMVRSLNGSILSSEINAFRNITSNSQTSYAPSKFLELELFAPSVTYSNAVGISSGLQLDANMKEEIIYDRFDTKGNLTEYHRKDDVHTIIIWGYAQTLPVAKIENATYSQVSSYISNIQTLSNNDNDRTQDNSGSEGALRVALNNLRNVPSLASAMITTYTYDPLIGITSITDPRGQSVFYEYDTFNRLTLTKDLDGNIIQSNEYNYKNSEEVNSSNNNGNLPFTFGAASVPNSYLSPIPPSTTPNSICYTGTVFTRSVELSTTTPQIGSQIKINGTAATALWVENQWGSFYAGGIRWIRFFSHNNTVIWDVNPSTGVITGISSFNCN